MYEITIAQLMLYVNIYINTFLLYLYYCIYNAGAILLISTCLNPNFDSNKKRPYLRDWSFLYLQVYSRKILFVTQRKRPSYSDDLFIIRHPTFFLEAPQSDCRLFRSGKIAGQAVNFANNGESI